MEPGTKIAERNSPVYKILILTSCALGGATSTSSILRGSPAAQQTAALHLIGLPVVDIDKESFLLLLKSVVVDKNGDGGRERRRRVVTKSTFLMISQAH